MPLIGDISPDASPDYFQRLIGPDGRGGGAGWVDNLSPDSGRKLSELAAETTPVSPDRLAEDGWHRFGSGDWQALTFAPPDGWPPMPGHGHHDLGGFELHHDSVPVIVDPGRGSYGDGEYETATVHSGITVDGQSPTPENRPYYSDAFRHMTIGSPPLMTRTRAGHQLTHSGFTRLKGLGLAIRTWDFDGDAIRITDRIDGRGQHRLSRRFFLAGRAKEEGGSATIVEQAHTYKISGGVPVTAIPKNRWAAYGESTEGTIIIMQETVDLPHESTVTIERS